MGSRHVSRRLFLQSAALAAAGLAYMRQSAHAATASITFDELYGKFSALGLEYSEKVKALTGQEVAMRGFMAPPLKAEAKFFVLTEIPMSICPFCSTDADWPDNIVVIYLEEAQTFEQANHLIEVEGRLEVGSWTDPETGFLSRLRIVGARFRSV